MEFVRQSFRREGTLTCSVGACQGSVFLAQTGQFSSAQAKDCEYRRSLSHGVVAVVEGSGKPLAHPEGLSNQDGDHALKAHLLKIVHLPFVTKTNKNRR